MAGAGRDPWIENRRHVKGYPHGRSLHIPRATLRALVRTCARCGEADPARLVVDHVDGNSLDHRPSNLQVLCRACHLAKTPASPYRGFLARDAARAGAGPGRDGVDPPRRRARVRPAPDEAREP